jgi:hypothetical protein
VNFGLEFIAIDGPVPDVHEVIKGKAFLAEVVLGSVFAHVAHVEFIFEIEIVGNFTPIHLIIIKPTNEYQCQLSAQTHQ